MPTVIGPTSPDAAIDINLAGASPHVVAYRLWWRDATSDWVVIAEGSTGDQLADHVRRPFTPGAQLYYWLGIGGHPNTTYEAILTLAQGGRVLPNGLVKESGQTDAAGVDVLEDWVSFT